MSGSTELPAEFYERDPMYQVIICKHIGLRITLETVLTILEDLEYSVKCKKYRHKAMSGLYEFVEPQRIKTSTTYSLPYRMLNQVLKMLTRLIDGN